VQTLLKAGKEYIGIMHLHKKINEKTIKKVCKEFVGKIKQIPPIKSAVKRVEREREIYYFKIVEIDEKDVLFRVGAEAGTYVRKLCFDVGKRLGIGAHMAELRRTKAGPFNEQTNLVTLQDLADAYWFWKNKENEKFIRYCIRPIEVAVSHLPRIWVMDSAVNSLCHGADLKIPGVVKFESGIVKEELTAVMTLKNELIAIGTAQMNSEDITKQDKGVVVRVHKVFMKPGVYPKIEVKK